MNEDLKEKIAIGILIVFCIIVMALIFIIVGYMFYVFPQLFIVLAIVIPVCWAIITLDTSNAKEEIENLWKEKEK